MEQIQEKVPDPLLIFCSDSVAVYDKSTFLSYTFGSLNVSYWNEGLGDEEGKTGAMFNILFEEMAKVNKNNSTLKHDKRNC